MNNEAPLNAAQQEIIDTIGASATDRPEFDPALARELQHSLDDRLDDLGARFTIEDPLVVFKRRLNLVLGCQSQFMFEYDSNEFSWSVPVARGVIAHKAIELSIHRKDRPAPLVLIDDAIESIINSERHLGEWLVAQPPTTRAELRAEANERLVAFLETWPPIKPQWWPTTESRVAAEFSDGRIRAQGKVDLTLGRADGPRAGKVVVDFKTGGYQASHVDDLRFYALIETLRIGTPPRMVASYYLDKAAAVAEAVTEDRLWAASDRLCAGIDLIVALGVDRQEPTESAGPRCRWCPRIDECETGQQHLRELDGTEGADF